MGGHPDDRLRPRADHSGGDGARHGPLAPARRDHHRRPAHAGQLEAAKAADYFLARFRSGANERQLLVFATCLALSHARRAVATEYCMFARVSVPWASVLQTMRTPASAASLA